jgi:hypothetical protein
VIRGDFRNATVVAEEDVEVLIWHRNYTPAEFSELITTIWSERPAAG